MPEDLYDENDENDENEDDRKVTLSRAQIRALEKRPKVEEHQRLQREIALLRLGIDAESAAGKMLLGNADLDWSNPESIKTLATEAGLLKPPAPQEQQGENEGQEELGDQTRERSDLGRGAAPDDGTPRNDPRASAADEARQALARGAREEEAVGHFIHRMAQAAQGGDQRAIVSG